MNEIQLIVTGDAVLAQMVAQSQSIYDNAMKTQEEYAKIKNVTASDMTKFVAEQKKYEEEIISFKKTIETLETELTKLKKATEENNKATEKSTSEYKKEAQTLAELSTEINSLNAANKTLGKNYEINAVQIEQNKVKIKELRTEYNNLSKAQTETKVSTELLTKFQNTQNLSIIELKALYKGLIKEYDNLTESERLNTEQGQKLTSQLSLISQKIKDGKEVIGDFRDSVGDYGRAITKNTEQLKDLLLQQNKLNTENKQGTQEYKDIQLAIIQTTAKIVKYRSEVEKVELQTKQLTTANKSTELSFKSIVAGTALGGGVANLISSGVQALGQELKAQITNIQEFEVSLQSLSSITGLTGTELDSVKDKAIEFSNKTGIAAKDILTAFELVGSARPELLSDSDALTGLTEKVITLSQAAKIDMTEATTALTGSLSQLGLDATEADRIINVLAASSLEGSGNISFLNDVFEKSGSVAKSAGISVEKLAAAAEILAPKILEGSEAGTQLKGTLLALQKEGYGFESGTFDLQDALEGVQLKLNSYGTEAEKVAFQTKLFGEGNIIAGQTLLDNIDNLTAFEAKITGTNVAYSQAATNTDTLTNTLAKLKESFNNVFIASGTSENGFAEAAKQVVELATKLLETAKNSEDLKEIFETVMIPVQELGDLLTMLAEAFGYTGDAAGVLEFYFGAVKLQAEVVGAILQALIWIVEKVAAYFIDFAADLGIASEATKKNREELEKQREGLAKTITYVDKLSYAYYLLTGKQRRQVTATKEVAEETETTADIIADATSSLETTTATVYTNLTDLHKSYVQQKSDLTDEEVELLDEYKSDFEDFSYAIIDLAIAQQEQEAAALEASQLAREEKIQSLSENALAIEQILNEAAQAFLTYKETEIQANIDALEERRTAIDEEIALENERIATIEGNLETEKELRDNEQENNYFRSQSDIAFAKQQIAEKQKLSEQLLKQQEQEAKKLIAIKKGAILAELTATSVQIAIDTALAISALNKNAVANPANIVNPFTQYIVFASGLVKILSGVALARQQIKALKDGEIDIQGAGTETSDSIPARLSRGESVINAKSTRKFKRELEIINNPQSTVRDLFNLNNSFEQKELKKYNLEVASSKFTDDKIISYLQKIVQNGETQTVVVDNSIVKISKNKIEKIKL